MHGTVKIKLSVQISSPLELKYNACLVPKRQSSLVFAFLSEEIIRHVNVFADILYLFACTNI